MIRGFFFRVLRILSVRTHGTSDDLAAPTGTPAFRTGRADAHHRPFPIKSAIAVLAGRRMQPPQQSAPTNRGGPSISSPSAARLQLPRDGAQSPPPECAPARPVA